MILNYIQFRWNTNKHYLSHPLEYIRNEGQGRNRVDSPPNCVLTFAKGLTSFLQLQFSISLPTVQSSFIQQITQMKTYESKNFFNCQPRKPSTSYMQTSYSTPSISTRFSNTTFEFKNQGGFEDSNAESMKFKKVRTERVLEPVITREITGELLNFKKCLHKNTERERDTNQYLAEITKVRGNKWPLGARQAQLQGKVKAAEQKLWEMQLSLLRHKAKKQEILLNSDQRRTAFN